MNRIRLNIILILAMAFSALSPKGYMPQISDAGFTINICAGGSFESRTIDKDHPNYEVLRLIHQSKSNNDDTHDMQGDCAYSFSNFQEYVPIYLSIEIIIKAFINTIFSISFVDILRISGMPPPSTGPPSF